MHLKLSNIGGLWGRRVKDSAEKWIKNVSEDMLLGGFKNRPGAQAWIGEHAGKFLSGAIMTNEILNDEVIWEKIDRIIYELIECQEEDGYLGTYLPEARWTNSKDWTAMCSWDLWVAKYCIIALVQHYKKFKDEKVLTAACRVADLVIKEFGGNGTRNLNETDLWSGLASGSVLESIMLLYGITKNEKYISFGERIVKYFWNEDTPGTPNLIKYMTSPEKLKLIGRGKAYEMMSCFVGLIEYARYSGENEYLGKVITARDNIAKYFKQLNGCMSVRESFKDPNTATETDDLENCVAFTWIQLNMRLFELTGDYKCLDYAEETALNHIMASICPDASTWSYFINLIGPKDYTYWSQLLDSEHFLTVTGDAPKKTSDDTEASLNKGAPMTCCHTNGQRVLGLFPRYVYTMKEKEISINFLLSVDAEFDLQGQKIKISQNTDFPRSGKSTVIIHTDVPVKIKFRIPAWAKSLFINGKSYNHGNEAAFDVSAGKTELKLDVQFNLRLMSPGHVNNGKFSINYGPLVYAVDEIPSSWAFNEVNLILNNDEAFKNAALQDENGWKKLVVKAFRRPVETGELQSQNNILDLFEKGDVILRPLMFAGLNENLDFAQKYDVDNLNFDRNIKTSKYRVIFPCFFNSDFG